MSGKVCLPPVEETPSNLIAYAFNGSAAERIGSRVMNAAMISSNIREKQKFFNSM
jgi:hypothetical protein